jgi:putative DNA primase/helicase
MRLVTAAEASSAHRLDDARIKQLVGGDTIVARGLHEAPIEFKFMATLLFFGNDDPNVTADDSFWSKLKKIPFLHKIGANDESYFDREIVPELPGFLALMVRGLKKYKGNKYRLHDPEAVIHATESYRESANPLSEFIEECCELHDVKSGIMYRDWRCSKAELRSAYQAFCVRNNLTKYAVGEKKFASYLAHYNVEAAKSGANRYWFGVRLNAEEVNRLTSMPEETEADF